MAFQVPPLPYPNNALEPVISAQTMTLHHDMHHAGYVSKLNDAIALHPALAGQTVEQLLSNLAAVPADIRTAVRNNGGGHLNHSEFWPIMGPPREGTPIGPLPTRINERWGSFEDFKREFLARGLALFGSGWVWLVRLVSGQLDIVTTSNQDNPISQGMTALLGNDVWEHAYYLSYQNRRADYLGEWWRVVNWDVANQRLIDAGG